MIFSRFKQYTTIHIDSIRQNRSILMMNETVERAQSFSEMCDFFFKFLLLSLIFGF